MGEFKFSYLFFYSTGKSADFMTEKFTFNQISGQRRAVYFNKRFFSSKTVVMQGVGDELFAGSAFFPDKNSCIAF